METTLGNKRSSIGSSESGATTLKITGLTKATQPVRAQRERIGVERKMECVHLLKYDSENEDRRSVHESNGGEIQHNR